MKFNSLDLETFKEIQQISLEHLSSNSYSKILNIYILYFIVRKVNLHTKSNNNQIIENQLKILPSK